MVKRVSGFDFKVDVAPRRDGDPASIVADSGRARAVLGWHPRFDDLATIVTHALAWERELMRRRSLQLDQNPELAPAAPAAIGSERP
jgi:UDP-glucose 4-epimerase